MATTTISRAPVTLFDPPHPSTAHTLEQCHAELCVLSSSSSGNCTALVFGRAQSRSITLLDAGLSPRRTKLLLHQLGLSFDMVREIIFTHLDVDHCHPGWVKALPRNIRLRMHKRHLGRAQRAGMLSHTTTIPFTHESFESSGLMHIQPVLMRHDSLGVAAFRFTFSGDRTLAFATDVGHPTAELIDLFRNVNVLAIESNYCPELQLASPRPEFLKQRIMGGAGHLSNQQCARIVTAAQPKEHVVLLHLSRECNTPDRAAALHSNAPYSLTVASDTKPTGFIPIRTS